MADDGAGGRKGVIWYGCCSADRHRGHPQGFIPRRTSRLATTTTPKSTSATLDFEFSFNSMRRAQTPTIHQLAPPLPPLSRVGDSYCCIGASLVSMIIMDTECVVCMRPRPLAFDCSPLHIYTGSKISTGVAPKSLTPTLHLAPLLSRTCSCRREVVRGRR